MKQFNIQLQPELSHSLDVPATVAQLLTLSANTSMDEGDDGGAYININLKSSDPVALWHTIQQLLKQNASLANACIIVCEGDDGWNDYLLLHHYDRTEALDELGPLQES